MGAVEKQLEQLNGEIAEVTTGIKDTQVAWLSAKDDEQKADFKEAWRYLVNKEDALNRRAAALEAQLTGTGVHTPILALNC